MKTDIPEEADDPRFIEGIYNYCDRWCERCSFTSRCMLYAMEEQDRDELADHDTDSDAFWDRLASIFKQTHEMIAQIAAEHGVDLDALDVEEAREEASDRAARSKTDPLARSAQQYISLVNGWFDNEYPGSEQQRDAEARRGDLPLVDFDAQDRAANIQDAVSVIRWYQFQIAVKITRGLIRDDIEADRKKKKGKDPVDTGRQSDSDGSAKVALIGMERSISAWARLRELLSNKADTILPIILHLEQLRRATEQAFPGAQSFVRPGFDEAPDRFVS
jgi:hypothetical protein